MAWGDADVIGTGAFVDDSAHDNLGAADGLGLEGLDGGGGGGVDGFGPDGDAVAPPELAGDGPVAFFA